jgi:raffinose/stachyose/melibiose transport system substrate-binding protein
MRPRSRLAVLLATASIAFAACSGGGASPSPSSASSVAPPPSTAASAPASQASTEPVTINWWHIANNDPGKSLFQKFADEYHAAHPNVTIKITVLENDTFKPKLQTEIQGGNVPDLFQSWGGGGMAEQVDAGVLKDITADVASWKDTINQGALGMYQYEGKQYGIPYDLGMVGVWYNKDLFQQAGITAPPATWEDLLAAVDKLKAKGITPASVGGSPATWTEMFWWAYLALRECGQETMLKATNDKDWTDPCFVEAGKKVKELVDKQPFQEGFLAANWDGAGGSAATMALEKSGMLLQGQWAPGTMQANTADKKPVAWNLGWFPFPSVSGGKGKATDGFGGGNGFAVGKDAPPEAVDFLKYISEKPQADRLGSLNTGFLPVTVGSESSVTDPQLTSVLDARSKADYVQLYLDQATSTDLGNVINDAVATLFAGTGTPEQVPQTIDASAKSGG